MTSATTLASLADDLAQGRTSSRVLLDECLARIDDPQGEGARTFLAVHRQAARTAAEAMDKLREVRAAPSPFAGIPVSIKDLFDMAGEVTRAGSRVLADVPPAAKDASSVARLRRAGFIVIGRTNMTEFAFSGVGLNPHYGTPRGPWERAVGRIPGGSSSGAGVSIVDGMAHAALGSDTGGSCRIPAAFTGIVGYKPTASHVPLDGAFPLAFSLDSIGWLARSVACCASLYAILADRAEPHLGSREVRGLRFAAPTNVVRGGADSLVAAAFAKALNDLSTQGAIITEMAVPELDEALALAGRGMAATEAFAEHRSLIEKHAAGYDRRVLTRLLGGRDRSAADYIHVGRDRSALVARAAQRLAGFDAMLLPTVAIVPPRIADLDADADYTRINLLVLRNTTLINTLDGCAISLPLNAPGEPPIGLMLAAPCGQDNHLFGCAAAVERALGRGG